MPILYGYSPALLPKPADWEDWLHVTGFWFLDGAEHWQPPAELAGFLDAGPPPVYVGFGSMVERGAEPLTRLAVEALQQAGRRGVLLSGWSGLGASPLPETILRVDSVPHEWLFPRMAAVVHHGGAGTTAAALRAGVPSVNVPFFADQAFWGWRVHQAGAAEACHWVEHSCSCAAPHRRDRLRLFPRPDQPGWPGLRSTPPRVAAALVAAVARTTCQPGGRSANMPKPTASRV